MMRAGPLSTRRLARLGRDFVELALGLGSSRACPLASTPRLSARMSMSAKIFQLLNGKGQSQCVLPPWGRPQLS
jgi:hypothetical protein